MEREFRFTNEGLKDALKNFAEFFVDHLELVETEDRTQVSKDNRYLNGRYRTPQSNS